MGKGAGTGKLKRRQWKFGQSNLYDSSHTECTSPATALPEIKSVILQVFMERLLHAQPNLGAGNTAPCLSFVQDLCVPRGTEQCRAREAQGRGETFGVSGAE